MVIAFPQTTTTQVTATIWSRNPALRSSPVDWPRALLRISEQRRVRVRLRSKPTAVADHVRARTPTAARTVASRKNLPDQAGLGDTSGRSSRGALTRSVVKSRGSAFRRPTSSVALLRISEHRSRHGFARFLVGGDPDVEAAHDLLEGVFLGRDEQHVFQHEGLRDVGDVQHQPA